MGHLVGTQHRLRILQLAIFFQKIATASAYAAFVAIFFIDKLLEAGSQGKNAQGPIWVLFTAIVLFGIVVKLATVCIQISVERDWATSIGEGDTVRLMRVNTWLRRLSMQINIPAICLYVDDRDIIPFCDCLLVRYGGCHCVHRGACFPIASAADDSYFYYLQILLSQIVYNLFPALESEYQQRLVNTLNAGQKMHNRRWIDPRHTFRDWREFSRLPVFYTSLSISGSNIPFLFYMKLNIFLAYISPFCHSMGHFYHTSKPLETGMILSSQT